MPSSARRRALLLLPGTALLFGCASPGPPRSPSLNLPTFATGLTATRHGNRVDVQLHLPTRTTDRLPLRGPLSAELCRNAVCLPRQSFPLATSSATLSDVLPPALASGPPRLLVYRVQLYNAAGRTAGFSDAVYAAAGAPPPPVQGFTLKGSRLGIVASWSTLPNDASAVVLRREDLEPPPAKTSSAAAH